MSQRIKLKFLPESDMISDLVINLADDGWDIQMPPCDETDHYVLIAEKCYEGEEPTIFPDGPAIH